MLICAVALVGGTPAVASADAGRSAVAEAVAASAPTELDALDVVQIGDRLHAAFPEGGAAELGVEAAEGLKFSTGTGETGAALSLPGAAGLSEATVEDDGSVTYAGDAQVPSVNIMTAGNGCASVP